MKYLREVLNKIHEKEEEKMEKLKFKLLRGICFVLTVDEQASHL